MSSLAESLSHVDDNKSGEISSSVTEVLCDAIANSNPFNCLRAVLPDIESGDHDASKDLLPAAVALGDTKKVRMLISAGHDRYAKSRLFGPPIEIATRNNDTELLTLLIEEPGNDFDLSKRGEAITSAVTTACSKGQETTLDIILGLPDNGWPTEDLCHRAFSSAASSGHVNIMMDIMKQPTFTVDFANMEGVFRSVCERGHLESARMLIDLGVDFNKYEGFGGPLHRACLAGRTKVARLLLNRGAKSYDANYAGNPLFLASKNGHIETVDLLLEYGMPIENGGCRGDVLGGAVRNEETVMVRHLLSKGLDLGKKATGAKALADAASCGYEDIVKILVQAGVDVDGRDKYDPPILEAMAEDQQHVVALLLALGAKMVDPLETDFADEFEDGTLPRCTMEGQSFGKMK